MDPVDALIDILHRLPPTKIDENVKTLCEACPEYEEALLGSVDQPLLILRDEEKGREFLGCAYNRDLDNYRSPWSNTYLPDSSTPGPVPSTALRHLEVSLNSAFDTYREMYFEGGISSVYLWDLDDEPAQTGKEMAFAGCVLVKKVLPGDQPLSTKGSWDSLHVFECQERGRSAKYKLTSTVMLVLETKTAAKVQAGSDGEGDGSVTLSGSMTRQSEQDCPLPSSAAHVSNIGRLVEDMEIKMRNLLSSVYFGKTKDVVNDLRSQSSLEARSQEDKLRQELAERMRGKRKESKDFA